MGVEAVVVLVVVGAVVVAAGKREWLLESWFRVSEQTSHRCGACPRVQYKLRSVLLHESIASHRKNSLHTCLPNVCIHS